jgi:hypothetical protein
MFSMATRLVARTIFFLLFLSGTVQGATIIKLIKKRKVAVIDAGKADGIKRGMRVCFYSSSGKKKACGKVRRVKANKAFVRVKSSRFGKVRKGMEAEPIGSLGGDYGGMASKRKSGFDAIDAKPVFIYAHIAPATYKKLAFRRIENGEEPDSAWSQVGDASPAIFPSFGIEVGFPLAGMGMGLGLRYRKRDFSSQADYDNQPENYMETVISETGTGLWLTAYFSKIDLDGMWMLLGGGIDIDSSSLKVQITQKSDEGEDNPVFDGAGSLTTISLSGTAHINIELTSSFGILLGTRFLIPVSGASKGAEGDEIIDDEVKNATSSESANDDLNFALNYSKSSFAFEIHIGFMMTF